MIPIASAPIFEIGKGFFPLRRFLPTDFSILTGKETAKRPSFCAPHSPLGRRRGGHRFPFGMSLGMIFDYRPIALRRAVCRGKGMICKGYACVFILPDASLLLSDARLTRRLCAERFPVRAIFTIVTFHDKLP